MHSCTLTPLLTAVAVGLLASTVSGQSVQLSAKKHLYESAGFVKFSLEATMLDQGSMDYEVLQNGSDVTSFVVVTVENEALIDVNGDGVLEDYKANVKVTFSGITITPGDSIFLVGEGTSKANTTLTGSAPAEVLPHVEVGASPSIVYLPSESGPVRANLLLADVPTSATYTFSVWLNSVDVTSQVAIVDLSLMTSPSSATIGNEDWHRELTLSVSALSLEGGDEVSLITSLSTPGSGTYIGSTKWTFDDTQGGQPYFLEATVTAMAMLGEEKRAAVALPTPS